MSEKKSRSAKTPKSIETFSLKDAPGHLLRRNHQRSEELFTNALGTDGVTRQQVALLVTTCQHPEASQSELVALTGIDKNTLAHMIKRMVDRGLLERRRTDHDGRTNAIRATAEGIALLEDVMPRVRKVQQQILDPLPNDLRPVFQRCLRILVGLEEP